MPIYEFTCDNCHIKIEKLCRIGDTGEALACPACSKQGLRKVFSLIQRTARGGGSGGGDDNVVSGGSACGTCSSRSCSTCGS